MAFQHARTKILRAACLRFQLLELMEHFAPGGVERFDERGIEASERLFVFREHAAERRFAGFESAGETGRKRLLQHSRAQMLHSGEPVAYIQLLLRQKTRNG